MTGQHTVLYDGDCPLCTFQSRLLTWLDWFHVMRLLPLAHSEAQQAAAAQQPPLQAGELRAEIHCLGADGRVRRGARALRFLALRMPLLFPIGLLLAIPGVIQLAQLFYGFVSERRLLFSRLFGCKGACSVLPARARQGDVVDDG